MENAPEGLPDILEEMKAYFDADVIGSYLFVQEGLLPFDEISDVDLAVSEDRKENLYRFLSNKGFVEEKAKEYGYRSQNYTLKPTGRFKKDDLKDFHVMIKPKDFKVLSTKEVLAQKVIRGEYRDNEVVIKVLSNKLTPTNKH